MYAFAGLDIGTSGCKIVVFDEQGKNICQASRAYHEISNCAGQRELQPTVVINAVYETLKEIGEKTTVNIRTLTIASLGESIVCLDKSGKVLGNSIVTGDDRGKEEVSEIEAMFGKKHIMEVTGLPISEMYGLPKYRWLSKNSDIFKRTSMIFFYEDLIGYLLTGKRKVSYSSASRSMAFDIYKKKWNNPLLVAAGLDEKLFSEPVESGTILGPVLPLMSKKLNLSSNLVVVVGAHDQVCAGLGSGILNCNSIEDGHGTCEVVLSVLPKESMQNLDFMLDNELPCEPYVNGLFVTTLEITTCGILTNWGRDVLFSAEKQKFGDQFFYKMDSQAQNEEISDLLILPQFGSSGNPGVNYSARGLIWGLTTDTTNIQLYRAFKESMAYQMKMNLDVLENLGIKPKKIIMTGGGSHSEFTKEITANVFGLDVMCLQTTEAGALGAAILGAFADKIYESLPKTVSMMVHENKKVKPNFEIKEKYNSVVKKYKKLFMIMHNFA